MIADEGVRQGKLFDDIMEDIRQELNFNSPKTREVYDYLVENYDRDKLFSNKFTIAASFGNVHGVYKPGNVKLTPIILDNSQKFVQ